MHWIHPNEKVGYSVILADIFGKGQTLLDATGAHFQVLHV
jgi:hypothetical protein